MNTAKLTELLNTDYCPWANQYVYWLKRPLGILIVAALLSLLCGLFVAPQGLVIASTIAVAIVIGMAWPFFALRGLECELRFSGRRGLEGTVSPVEVIIRNRWPFPVWGLAIEDGFFLRQQHEDATAVALSGIGAWSKTTFRWSFQPECRGVYPSAAAKIATEFPFGVWKAREDITTHGSLTVWPRTVPLANRSLSSGQHRARSNPNDKHVGHDGDRVGIRPFRNGDTLRLVHWPQTAKCGRLIVSERQGPSQAMATVAIDTAPGGVDGFGAESSIEWSIRIAASLCEYLTKQNIAVTLLANRTSITVRPTSADRRMAMDSFAQLVAKQPIDVTRARGQGERFIVTADPAANWGAGWKRIVLSPAHGDAPHESIAAPPALLRQPHFQLATKPRSSTWAELDSPQSQAWLTLDRTADPLQEFAVCWNRQANAMDRIPSRLMTGT